MVTTATFFASPLARPCGQSVMAAPHDNRNPEEVQSAAVLLPEVYAGLRRLAQALTVNVRPGQTLQLMALVHEAYLRLGRNQDPG
jgi:hypothetical protein